MAWFFFEKDEITTKELTELTQRLAYEALKRICAHPKRVLLLPPDITRAYSGLGKLTNQLYHFFSDQAEVYLMPTLGQHQPHGPEQNKLMFGDIPQSRILVHDWLKDVELLGYIEAAYVKALTDGKADWAIPISLNKFLFTEKWDLIINLGLVVPHEVLGFANHNKNYFIGLAGKDTIAASHLAAACFGIENNLGLLLSPIRHCFNKAEAEFLSSLPDVYLLVVLDCQPNGKLVPCGFYGGDDLDTYLLAAKRSQQKNIKIVPPLRKVIALMQADEFSSTWVANKAIYRTRKALSKDAELIILAPGLKRFGEQPEIDKLIRKYGYRGTENIIDAYTKDPELKEFAHATAHLIHGSTEGRFKVTYCPGYLSKAEIEGVGYQYLNLDKAWQKYQPDKLRQGFNTLEDGEEIYFISAPSIGLWSVKESLNPT